MVAFFGNVISRSIASSITVVINIIVITLISMKYQISNEIYSTICVVLTVFTGFLLLIKISKPFNIIRVLLLISMILIFTIATINFKDLFAINLPEKYKMLVMVLAILATYNFTVLNAIFKK